MKLRKTEHASGSQIEALAGADWVALKQCQDLAQIAPEGGSLRRLESDMLAVLQLDASQLSALRTAVTKCQPDLENAAPPQMPIEPRSFRDFMLFEKHVIDASRGYARRFLPGPFKVASLIEKVTGKPFGKFKPHPLWYRQPIYYFGNHLNFVGSDREITWPKYTAALDYELELGAILAKPLFNATEEEARDAIGGFVVLNDFSARDCQRDEMNSGFGPQKAKHFISAMSQTVVTADEIIPQIDALTGSVWINGKQVAECSAANSHHSLAAAIAYASKGEQLHPGELFGSGTLPGGSGMENGHWLSVGDTLTLRLDAIGEITSHIVEDVR